MLKVGLVGLGHNGRALGQRLIQAGYRVIGYDPDLAAAAKSGLRTVGTAARLHEECSLHLVGADGEHACALLEELLPMASGAETTIVIAGAITPEEAHSFALGAAAAGIDLLDAPIVGGEEAIMNGTAAVFASGDQDALDRCRDLLSVFGTILYVGDAGSGQVARTVNDLVYWATTLATYEAFTIARACDMDLSRIRDAVLKASGASQALGDWGGAKLPEAPAELAAALALARALKLDTPLLDQVNELLGQVDQEQLSGLFNLGIADLSGVAPAPPAPAADENAARSHQLP
ncbi:MAG: NAD(P)-dependent oxidoreductase, partial [Chloroflexota bacterium]|nr:NAD(P)-dependent oxidoreductase [Chloroflexota bacterium]